MPIFMKYIFLLSLITLCSHANAQLISGAIVDENRKMLTKTDFTIAGNYEGVMVFEIAVDIKGVVKSERLIAEKSTVKSTPAMVEAKNYLKTLTFEPGTYYPVHHHALVRVNFVKQKPLPPTGKNVN